MDEKAARELAEWAEHEMTLTPNSATALRGAAAAEFGRATVERALGRPSIDPNARPGQHSPVRQVRLPVEVNEQLVAVAAAEHRRPSDVIRSALADYLATRAAG
jgi:hypothetical protein